MPVAGRQLSIDEALALCYVTGWRAKQLRWAVAIMTAESGRYVEAWHDNIDAAGDVLSTDRGLFQINDKAHPDFPDAYAFHAVPNARFAFELQSAAGWSPWAVFNKGTYKQFLPLVRAMYTLGLWRRLRSTILEELT